MSLQSRSAGGSSRGASSRRKPFVQVGPNGELAERLRALGLQRVVDSARVRAMLGLPVHSQPPLTAEQRAARRGATAKQSPHSMRYQSMGKGALAWQRAQVLREGAQVHAGDIKWQRDLARLEAHLGNYAESIEAWKLVEGLAGRTADDLFEHAHALYRSGREAAARDAEARAMEASKPKSGSARFGIGDFFERHGDWDWAASAYAARFSERQHKAGESDLGELAFRAGLAMDRCYRWDEAEQYYRFALAEKPDTGYWSYKLGLSLERQGKWLEAADQYLHAAGVSDGADLRYRRYRAAFVLREAARYEDACTVFFADESFVEQPEQAAHGRRFSTRSEPSRGTSVAAVPGYSPAGWLQRASEARRSGDAEAEAEALRRAIDRTTAHPTELYERLAAVEFRMGRFELAAESIVRSRLFQRPDGIDLKNYRGTTGVARSGKYFEYSSNYEVREKVVMFESYHGAQASCHPLAIFLSIVDDPRFAGYTFVWSLNEGVEVPEALRERDDVVVAVRDSDLFHRFLATAGWLVSNVSFPPYFVRRPEQRYLNTWHGTPIKTLGKDMQPSVLQHANVARNFLHASHMISPCAWTTEVLLDRYDVRGIFPGKVAELGSPRLDRGLAMTDQERLDLRSALGIEEGQTVVLYAPTWRGVQGAASSDTDLVESALDALDDLPEDAVVLFRGHHYAEKHLRAAGLDHRLVPASIDTNQLMSAVDVLITDYSSIFFDFLAFNRPIVFYVPDEENYKTERGLYIEAADLPGIICRSAAHLAAAVMTAIQTPEDTEPLRSDWNGRYAPHEDGLATQRAIDFFFFGDASHEVEAGTDKPKVLVHAGLLPNGITRSVQNLLWSIDPDSVALVNLAVPSTLSDPERLEQFELMPDYVAEVGRVGDPAYTAEERWVVNGFNRTNRFFSQAHRELAARAYRREFLRILGPVEFDAVVEFDGYAPFWAQLLSASEAGRKLIYQHNDLYAEWTEKYPELSAVFEQYEAFDEVVSISPAIAELNREHLSSLFDIAPEKFVYAHNQIDPAAIRALSEEPLDDDVDQWLQSTSGHLFVTMGRLSVEKAQDLLLDSFAEMADRADSRLIIIGSGFLKSDLEAQAERLGIAKRVFFAGQRLNPMPIVRAADTFVLTSKHEGQPMVLGEAMVLGKAIISSDLPGTRDLLEGRYGELVQRDAAAFAEAMLRAARGDVTTLEFDADAYRKQALQEFAGLAGVPAPRLQNDDETGSAS